MAKVDKNKMILRVINNPLPDYFEEEDCIYWLSGLAEARKYLEKKIAKLRRERALLSQSLDILESTISQKVRDDNIGTATERKKITEDRYYMSNEYKETNCAIIEIDYEIEKLWADLNSVIDKSFAVRKICDFTKTHMLYEE